MSSFGENYKKNNLLDDIQHFFSEGGTIEEMFDVLRYIFEYGKTPLDDLIKENQELKKQIECLTLEKTLLQQVINESEEFKKYKEVFDKINVFLDNHDKNAGKLYYKYDNKYLLSEIKEDIRDILKEVK